MERIRREGLISPTNANWFHLINRAKSDMIHRPEERCDYVKEFIRTEARDYINNGKYEGDVKIFSYGKEHRKKKAFSNYQFINYAENFLRKITGDLAQKKERKIVYN